VGRAGATRQAARAKAVAHPLKVRRTAGSHDQPDHERSATRGRNFSTRTPAADPSVAPAVEGRLQFQRRRVPYQCRTCVWTACKQNTDAKSGISACFRRKTTINPRREREHYDALANTTGRPGDELPGRKPSAASIAASREACELVFAATPESARWRPGRSISGPEPKTAGQADRIVSCGR